MSALRDLATSQPQAWVSIGGLVIGIVFGALVFRTNFCTMGALSDIVNLDDYRRMRSWLLAAATAIIGTQVLAVLGAVPLARSMYLTPNLNWLGHIVGGLMFGYGMVFAGGCASRNLARVGGGDLRSLLTLIVLGIFAYMTIGGLLGPVRAWLEQSTALGLGTMRLETQGIGELAGRMLGIDAARGGLIAGLAVAAAAIAYCFANREFRASPVHILAGLGIGMTAVAGWLVTGLAFDDLADKPISPISLTYVRPTGDTLEWLQRFTALGWPGFGVASVFGAVFGAHIVARAMGRFQLTTFSDRNDTVRNLMGAALMGVGGVLALGCTVGQAITGVSTLAIGSFITFAAITAGGVWGLKALERQLMAEV